MVTSHLVFPAMVNSEGTDRGLNALSHPVRRRIIRIAWHQERSASDIASRFKLTRPAISHHLSVLREAGLIGVRRSGTHRFYRTRIDRMEVLRRTLDAFWDEPLTKLKRAAEAQATKDRRSR